MKNLFNSVNTKNTNSSATTVPAPPTVSISDTKEPSVATSQIIILSVN